MHPCARGAASKQVRPLNRSATSESVPPRRCPEQNLSMNKYERQSRFPADRQTLAEEIDAELPELPTEVLAVDDAPSLAPRAPLTAAETRTILMSLMVTMFLAALDQT